MARYEAIDTSLRFLAVDLEKQHLPGSFDHAEHHLPDHEFDLSLFDARYRNDQSGACAYPPGMLLKVILCAYALGVASSRGIERLCREHLTFIALSGDTVPTSPTRPTNAKLLRRKCLSASARTTACPSNLISPRNPGNEPKACIGKPPSSAIGELPTRRTERAAKVSSGKASAPPRRAPRWPPAKGGFKAIPASLPSMPSTGSSSKPGPRHRLLPSTTAECSDSPIQRHEKAKWRR